VSGLRLLLEGFAEALVGFVFVVFQFGFEVLDAPPGVVPHGSVDDRSHAAAEDFVGGGEGAEFGVVGEVVDGGLGGLLGLGFGQVEAGDLEGVEEESGAAGVEVVGGDALDDLADGGLDGGAVLGQWQVEGAEAGFAGLWVGDGFAGGVVVVAEVLVAERVAAAAAAVGEDVAALEALGLVAGAECDLWFHVGIPSPVRKYAKSSKDVS
jgi:hypothetical protein